VCVCVCVCVCVYLRWAHGEPAGVAALEELLGNALRAGAVYGRLARLCTQDLCVCAYLSVCVCVASSPQSAHCHNVERERDVQRHTCDERARQGHRAGDTWLKRSFCTSPPALSTSRSLCHRFSIVSSLVNFIYTATA
jgi:hypothetical protein